MSAVSPPDDRRSRLRCFSDEAGSRLSCSSARKRAERESVLVDLREIPRPVVAGVHEILCFPIRVSHVEQPTRLREGVL
ncbi:MAG: hypothetical protein QOG94_3744 [Solirubrobacteraceae bacterium]|jgi:hypothetical protein|nr:hypothetical protein [Solirubrobacteraceae bacterium]